MIIFFVLAALFLFIGVAVSLDEGIGTGVVPLLIGVALVGGGFLTGKALK